MKYEITNIEHPELKGLFRVRALTSFGNVKKGDLGGYIQCHSNLSRIGNCWVFDNACIYENARISENAEIYDNAIICDGALVMDYAKVYGNAQALHRSVISEYAKVYGNSKIWGDLTNDHFAWVRGRCEIHGNSEILCNKIFEFFNLIDVTITKENFLRFKKLEKWFPQFSIKLKTTI